MVDREDVRDLDFIDATELASDGSVSFKTAPVTGVSSGTITVNPSADYFGLVYGDEPIEADDIFILSGATAGNGSYTVASVLSNTTFTVVEAIPDSTGGTAEFRHPSGAKKVGVDPSAIASSTSTNLQKVLEDLDASIAAGGITASQHRTLRQLIHFIQTGGPALGFATGAYRETLPVADAFPTSIIWWESNAKLKKIVELTLTYNANKTISTEQWQMYDTDGTTVIETVTDTITYSGVFETSRTRAIS